jgi:carboxylesterase type B
MANDIANPDAGLSPVIEIAAGKLRGGSSAGIYSFKGIPYGISPAGRNRFMPPQRPLPWAGVRDAIAARGNCQTARSAARCSKPCLGRRTLHWRGRTA